MREKGLETDPSPDLPSRREAFKQAGLLGLGLWAGGHVMGHAGLAKAAEAEQVVPFSDIPTDAKGSVQPESLPLKKTYWEDNAQFARTIQV